MMKRRREGQHLVLYIDTQYVVLNSATMILPDTTYILRCKMPSKLFFTIPFGLLSQKNWNFFFVNQLISFLSCSNSVPLKGEMNSSHANNGLPFQIFFKIFSSDQPLHFYMRAPHLQHARKSVTTLIN